MTDVSEQSVAEVAGFKPSVERLAYGYELMHTAICHMAGTSGADGRWYMQKAQEVQARVSPVFSISPDSNPPKHGDCLSNYRAAIPNSQPAVLEVLHQYVSDLRYPPTGDSVQRRIERAERVISLLAAPRAGES